MERGGTRSRLFELRRDRTAARRSAELLERKREVLLRELSRRSAAAAELRAAIEPRYSEAHGLLRIARVEAGSHAIRSAALAQTSPCRIERRESRVMGVPLVSLEVACDPFRASYGTAGTTESMDAAGASFAALLPELLAMAVEELAARRLRVATRKATRLLNSVQRRIIPRIELEIRTIVDGLDEEERDEGARRKARVARHHTTP